MTDRVRIGDTYVGQSEAVYVVAEIGVNHNGDIENARRLIDIASHAGCDAVKFQKRLPEVCVPESQRNIMRETPWGVISYMDYRRRVEFNEIEYDDINRYCSETSIDWFASCWDVESVDFMQMYDPICYKIPSAKLTDDRLVEHIRRTEVPVILSTGMSTLEEIRHAVSLLDCDRLVIAHTTSTYPCKTEELNLRMIQTLRDEFECPVGYSGHEVGLQTTVAAVALGACLVERHITIDRSMWGSDQSASVEPGGLDRLVRDIRVVQKALGTGIKEVYETEGTAIRRLRNG